ncbi:hypothetical protein SNOG_15936 [Parastagonospora nodorum SN15]|uniref:Uncharacterized protein n=1 Tax=Phaeosphaeria nodorum (strain SN15 / ATCC MYA-4574 / FGSC 10173) TaxID=321614 RepID=Q0TXC7_PHANO|nr:hypothetical protein SNOG_15936 [Parastagonospora nodorum SN15]EAT76774.2 hypothetical protein SNOG_15936 [Parastagonospora nodorum SN15]
MLLDDQGTADAQGMMENMDFGAEEDNEAGRAKKDRAEESSGAGKHGDFLGIIKITTKIDDEVGARIVP